jgi:NADH-quinone oxidoreductase subunit G
MPSITINGKKCEFTQGQMILQVANANSVEIPQYCYHDGLSVVASCRICLGEAMTLDPKTGSLAPYMGGKLFPTCQTPAMDGMVVYTDSPKAVANQKAVMEFLLINHPLDCPVCDQSGECFLQDYSYLYGRGVSRFEEQKVKQPKKDVGPHVYLYSDRCIMCTRCVRFTREVSGTSELMVMGRGNKEEIDVFPGMPLDNELSANVIDLCPVGALLDKDFLFSQRVWFLKETPSIDPLTASGDNIFVHHNEGKIYRVKPRTNLAVNKWWITDEVRYGWKFVHSDERLRTPMRKQFGALIECDYTRAYDDACEGLQKAATQGRLAMVISPMLPCEEAYVLAQLARMIDPRALLVVGPVPMDGQSKTLPAGVDASHPKAFHVSAEKAPNARGVRRVLGAFGGGMEFGEFVSALRAGGQGGGPITGVVMTANYPSEWGNADLATALRGKFVVLIDTLRSTMTDLADIVLPGATFAEKAGTFENWRNMLQAFEQAIPVIEMAKTEGQLALDLIATLEGRPAPRHESEARIIDTTRGQVAAGVQVALPRAVAFHAANVRADMVRSHTQLSEFAKVSVPVGGEVREPDMKVMEL